MGQQMMREGANGKFIHLTYVSHFYLPKGSSLKSLFMKHAIETASVGLVLILHTRGVALLSSKGQMEEIWSFDFKRYIRLLPNAELEAALDLSVFHVVAIEIYRSMVEDDDYETAFDDEDEFLPLEKRAKLRILLFPTSQMKYVSLRGLSLL